MTIFKAVLTARRTRAAGERLGVDVLQAIGPAPTLPLPELLTRMIKVRPGVYDDWTPEDLAAGLQTLRVRVVTVVTHGRPVRGVRRSQAHRAVTGGAR